MNEKKITLDNVPEDLLEDMLQPPKISITHRDEKYMYGEFDVSAADIIIAKKNPETNKVKQYINAIEDIEKEWEFIRFIHTDKTTQVRKYKKLI